MLSQSGTTLWLSNTYSSVVEAERGLRCVRTTRTPAGTVFEFIDTFQAGPARGCFELKREVAVREAASGDAGFLSRFSLGGSAPRPLSQYEVFIPGIWYLDNRNVPAYALASDLSEDAFICREDRMPLPLVMIRDKLQGATLTLIHSHPDGATCLADYTAERVVDLRVQVASLGVFGQDHAAAALCYPGSEGQRSKKSTTRWAS